MAKTLKQLQADEKRKKLKVRKLEAELKKEKGALGRMATQITAARKKEAEAKKRKAAAKKKKKPAAKKGSPKRKAPARRK